MTTSPPFSSRGRSEVGYVVQRPQSGDVLANALHLAFGNGTGLPDDMQRALNKLNRIEVYH